MRELKAEKKQQKNKTHWTNNPKFKNTTLNSKKQMVPCQK